jgi:hypothetical protein
MEYITLVYTLEGHTFSRGVLLNSLLEEVKSLISLKAQNICLRDVVID